ncbi:MAG: trypsin-like peptidase domain-containing protein [Bryobacteraceae bacterium]
MPNRNFIVNKLNRSNPKQVTLSSAFLCAVLLCDPALGAVVPQLDEFSNSIQNLTARVSPSVVKIQVTRYRASEESSSADVASCKQEAIGSGVIIDPDGYIITNAHVVQAAQRILVSLQPSGQQSIAEVIAQGYAKPREANLVGVFKEGDLAVIKIPGGNLPALPLADYDKLRQGQVVFAFGSPAGLQNSVSMGVVSSIARQPDRDSPFLYIQTDAPINPGNSGGPLVNTGGEIVGLNTFILSQSGGNEGVGFAVPSMLIKWVWPELRKRGHVDRTTIGVGVQAITPLLSNALKLQVSTGVLISDVTTDGPAAAAGLKVNDVLLSMDGRPIEAVPGLLGFFFEHRAGKQINVQVLRGSEKLSFDVTPIQEPHEADRLADILDSANNLIPSLGFIALTVDKKIEELLGSLRLPTGVVLVTRIQSASAANMGLQPGDVVHSVNNDFVYDIDGLRAAMSKFKTGDPVALLVERSEQLLYVAFEAP